MAEVHVCELLRSTEQNDWLKYQEPTYLTLDVKGGVTLRTSSNNTLILDLPASAIDSTHVVSNTTIRIVTKGASKIALQFERSQSLDLLVGNYEVNNVSVSKDAGLNNPSSYHMFHQKKGGFPDVNDPAVQEVLLRLLFSSPFDDFVQDLEGWLQKTREQL